VPPEWRTAWPFTEPVSSLEEEATTYYQGLNEAVNRLISLKLHSSKFIQGTTAWQVVFVAGKSEYMRSPALQRIIDRANKSGINISVIGIEIGDNYPVTNQETKDLQSMAKGTYGTAARDIKLNTTANSAEIEARSNDILDSHINALRLTPIIKNVEINETIYRYLEVVSSTPGWSRKTLNPDGTTTLYYRLGDLLQDEEECIVIHTKLNFTDLPVDVSGRRQSRKEVDFRALNSTPISMLTYNTKLSNKTTGAIWLPEGNLSIKCGAQCSPLTSEVQSLAANTISNNTSTEGDKSTEKKQPGFEALAGIVGLVAMAFAARRKMSK
jgi:PGF-CTERM protein